MDAIYHIAHLPLARETLLVSVFAMAGIIVLLFSVLCCQKLSMERRDRSARTLKDRYRTQLAAWLSGSGDLDRPRRHREYLAWSDVLAGALAAAPLPERSGLQNAARLLALDRYFLNLATSPLWLKRFASVEKLGLLRLPEMKGAFRTLLQSEKDRRVISKIIWALSLVADAEVLKTIHKALWKHSLLTGKYPEFVYAAVIASFRERHAEAEFLYLLDRLEASPGLPLRQVKAMVDALGSTGFATAAGWIKDLFHRHSDQPELRVACVRALEALHDSAACPLIKMELSDEDWRVRAVAAKGAGFCADSVLDTLSLALKDGNYHVRMNAAATLARLGEPGIEALKTAGGNGDRFAAEAARYALRGAPC